MKNCFCYFSVIFIVLSLAVILYGSFVAKLPNSYYLVENLLKLSYLKPITNTNSFCEYTISKI